MNVLIKWNKIKLIKLAAKSLLAGLLLDFYTSKVEIKIVKPSLMFSIQYHYLPALQIFYPILWKILAFIVSACQLCFSSLIIISISKIDFSFFCLKSWYLFTWVYLEYIKSQFNDWERKIWPIWHSLLPKFILLYEKDFSWKLWYLQNHCKVTGMLTDIECTSMFESMLGACTAAKQTEVVGSGLKFWNNITKMLTLDSDIRGVSTKDKDKTSL